MKQYQLPLKFRFKITAVGDFLQSMVSGIQFIFQRNADFLSLTKHDQNLLLHRTLKQVAGLGACFILRRSDLYDELGFYTTIETIYSPKAIEYGAVASKLFDSDVNVVKLFLSIMIFSTLDCTYYLDKNINQLENIKLIQQIQGFYAELAWKYLLYNYDFRRAVKCFSNLIRCVFIDIQSLIIAAEAEEFHLLMDSVVEKTQQVLNLHEA